MERQIDEITNGEDATIAGVINDLKEKGYKIKDITREGNIITGIELSEEKVVMEKNSTKIIEYKLIYSEEISIRYFVEIQGKDYEILYNNGNISIETEEINLEEIDNEPIVLVENKNSEIVKSTISGEKQGNIILESDNIGGIVEIGVKEKNSKIRSTLKVLVREPVTNITLEPSSATVLIGNTIKLTAIAEPNNTTDSIIWSTSDTNIVDVSQNGIVTGRGNGTATIKITCGDKEASCLVTSTNKISLAEYAKENNLSMEDLGFSITYNDGGNHKLALEEFGGNITHGRASGYFIGSYEVLWDYQKCVKELGAKGIKLTYRVLCSSRGRGYVRSSINIYGIEETILDTSSYSAGNSVSSWTEFDYEFNFDDNEVSKMKFTANYCADSGATSPYSSSDSGCYFKNLTLLF